MAIPPNPRPRRNRQAVRTYLGHRLIDWESEPAVERSSRFAESQRPPTALQRRRRSPYAGLEQRRSRPAPKGRGKLLNVWLVLLGTVAAGALLVGALGQLRKLIVSTLAG